MQCVVSSTSQVRSDLASDWAANNGLDFFQVSAVSCVACCAVVFHAAHDAFGVHVARAGFLDDGFGLHAVLNCEHVCVRVGRPQAPPSQNVDAPFVALAQAFQRNYEEKAVAFVDACRNF